MLILKDERGWRREWADLVLNFVSSQCFVLMETIQQESRNPEYSILQENSETPDLLSVGRSCNPPVEWWESKEMDGAKSNVYVHCLGSCLMSLVSLPEFPKVNFWYPIIWTAHHTGLLETEPEHLWGSNLCSDKCSLTPPLLPLVGRHQSLCLQKISSYFTYYIYYLTYWSGSHFDYNFE